MRAMHMLVLVGAISLFGCSRMAPGRYVQRGMDAYVGGDYALAAEHFNYVEQEGFKLNAQGEVRFFVYRGLTLVRLGKQDEGKAYLLKGKAAYQAGDPHWLKPEIVTEMDETLAQMGVK